MTWPDLVNFFLPKVAQGLLHKVHQNPAALRAAFFRYLRKTSGGVAPTPRSGRGLNALGIGSVANDHLGAKQSSTNLTQRNPKDSVISPMSASDLGWHLFIYSFIVPTSSDRSSATGLFYDHRHQTCAIAKKSRSKILKVPCQVYISGSWVPKVPRQVYISGSWVPKVPRQVYISESWVPKVPRQVYISGSWVPKVSCQVYISGSWVSRVPRQIYISGSWVPKVPCQV